jgi:hypothetical protein
MDNVSEGLRMQGERIRFDGTIVLVKNLALPDVRWMGLLVPDDDCQAVFNFAVKSAATIYNLILDRRTFGRRYTHNCTLDVPDLIHRASQAHIPFTHLEELRLFCKLHHALAQHFLPDADMTPYSHDNGKATHGWRYVGEAWLNHPPND